MVLAVSPNGAADYAEVDTIAERIRLYVLSQGQATRDEIRKSLAAEGITTEQFGRGFARICNQVKMLTEVTRDDGKKAYELKRDLGDLSVSQALLLVASVTERKERERYEDYYEAVGQFVLTSPALASRAVPGNPSARVWARTAQGDVLLFSGYYAAMVEEALDAPGVPSTIRSAIRYHTVWDQQALPAALLTRELNPVPPSRPGQSGQGLTDVEALPAGTRIPFTAVVPGSHVSPLSLRVLMVAAGRWVGFSPASHKQGWGRFVPEFTHIPEVETDDE